MMDNPNEFFDDFHCDIVYDELMEMAFALYSEEPLLDHQFVVLAKNEEPSFGTDFLHDVLRHLGEGWIRMNLWCLKKCDTWLGHDITKCIRLNSEHGSLVVSVELDTCSEAIVYKRCWDTRVECAEVLVHFKEWILMHEDVQ